MRQVVIAVVLMMVGVLYLLTYIWIYDGNL